MNTEETAHRSGAGDERLPGMSKRTSLVRLPSRSKRRSPAALRRTEEMTHQVEFAKMDYSRLGTQEQALMNKRSEHWSKFFAILAVPGGATGVIGLHGAIYLLGLVPFFLACIALEIKHDEKVLRYDVRKQMKLLAATFGFENHYRVRGGSLVNCLVVLHKLPTVQYSARSS